MFDHLLGNEPIKTYLRKAVESNRLPHALLFAGPPGVGKSLFAKALSVHLLQTTKGRIEEETHPDFHCIRADGKSGLHSIDTLRAIIDEVHTTPFEAPAKVFVIVQADRMQPAAANAFLKILEEPTLGTTFILLTEHPNELLSTVRSRCIRLVFQPLLEQEVASFLRQHNIGEHFAKQAQGSLQKALTLANQSALEKPLFDLLTQRPTYAKLVGVLEKMDSLIEDDDPVKKNQNAEHLFTSFLLWHRDQYARQMNVDPANLFFPDQQKSEFSIAPLETVIKAIDEARLAFQRNIKFSVCLEWAYSASSSTAPKKSYTEIT